MYEYRAKLVRCIDGDTVELEVDLGFKVTLREKFRLIGIDTPEKNSKIAAEREAAKAATDYLVSLLAGEGLTIKTQKDAQGKYGRYLCTLFTASGVDVNQEMIKTGHAVAYDGGAK